VFFQKVKPVPPSLNGRWPSRRRMTQVKLDPEAKEVLKRIRVERGEPYVSIVEDGCCSFSNVMVTLQKPSDDFQRLGDVDGYQFYIKKSLAGLYGTKDITIRALKRIDDSFSVETEYGYKLFVDYDVLRASVKLG